MDFEKAANAIRLLIEAFGDDISREGLRDTPSRVAEIWKSFFNKNQYSDENILQKSFLAENYDNFVIIKNINFSSFCEHHLLPFFGKISIAYIPRDNVVIGLSKIARIVDKYTRRLQIQERMNQQILDAISKNTKNLGVLIIISAQHMCMTSRGVMKPGAETITRAASGQFLEKKDCVIEAQQLIFGSNGKEF